jgi:hypothetical protein
VRKLERVSCEVQEDLLQPVGVPHHHRRNLLVDVTRHLDALVARAHAQQGQGPLDFLWEGEVEALQPQVLGFDLDIQKAVFWILFEDERKCVDLIYGTPLDLHFCFVARLLNLAASKYSASKAPQELSSEDRAKSCVTHSMEECMERPSLTLRAVEYR